MKNAVQWGFRIVRHVVPPCMQTFSLGDDQEGHFQAILSLPKSPQKISHFLKTHYFQLFQALGRFPSSFSCPEDTLQCPSLSLGPSGGLVLTQFFLRQKFHFRKFGLISKSSALSGPESITSFFSGTPQYVWPRWELLRWSRARDWWGGTHDFKGFEDFW